MQSHILASHHPVPLEIIDRNWWQKKKHDDNYPNVGI